VNARLSAWWIGALSVLVAVMPLLFSVSWHIKALPALILMIVGLVLIFSNAATRRSYRHAWPIVAVCMLGVLYTVSNILGHGLGWNAFDLPSHILLYLATAAVFSLPLRMRWVWLGFSLTGILLGAVCLVQHYGMGIDRAYGLNGGDWGAIEFAMMMMVLSLLAWLQLFFSTGIIIENIVHGAGGVLGIYGALLTQSRGPLLAFIPVLLILLLLYGIRTRRWFVAIAVFVAILGGGVLAAGTVHNVSTPAPVSVASASLGGPQAPAVATTAGPSPASAHGNGVVLKRFADVGSEMTSYNAKTDARGAIRERLEMWHTAVHAFRDHPLVGVGIDQFGAYIRQQVALGQANPAIAKYNHPHNEYLEAAATGGVPGLIVVILLFAVPLWYFVRHALYAGDSGIILAMAGVALVAMYILCALTDNVFYRAMPHSLYFFLIPGLAVGLGRITSSQEVVQRV
jgi:O-antigen ligase